MTDTYETPENDSADTPETDNEYTLLEQSVSLDSDELGDREGDDGYDPEDSPSVAERFGTTFTEQHEGETLDQLLDEEVPDVDPYAEAERSESGSVLEADVADTHVARPGERFDDEDDGRGDALSPLVQEDEGAHSTTEPELVASESGGYIEGESAEEDAVRLDPDQ